MEPIKQYFISVPFSTSLNIALTFTICLDFIDDDKVVPMYGKPVTVKKIQFLSNAVADCFKLGKAVERNDNHLLSRDRAHIAKDASDFTLHDSPDEVFKFGAVAFEQFVAHLFDERSYAIVMTMLDKCHLGAGKCAFLTDNNHVFDNIGTRFEWTAACMLLLETGDRIGKFSFELTT